MSPSRLIWVWSPRSQRVTYCLLGLLLCLSMVVTPAAPAHAEPDGPRDGPQSPSPFQSVEKNWLGTPPDVPQVSTPPELDAPGQGNSKGNPQPNIWTWPEMPEQATPPASLLAVGGPPGAAVDDPGRSTTSPGDQSDPQPPVLQSPPQGTVVTINNYPPLAIPEVAWLGVSGATNYRIQFSQDIGFANRFEITTHNTRFTPQDAGQFPDGTWYWRVRAEEPVASLYSSSFSFTKQWADPNTKPVLLAPTEGAERDFYDETMFTWQPLTGAAYYRFQIATSREGFSSPVYSADTLATMHQPATKLTNGTYYWRVTPRDPRDRDGTPSEVRSFVVKYRPVPALLQPEDNATPTFTPTFSWTAVQGAEYYHLQYTTDPAFFANVNELDTRNTTFTPDSPLPNDKNYYWRVRAHAGNSVGEWSEVRSFVKQWYIQSQLLTPVNLYQHVQSPVFSWTPVEGASRYRIEVNYINNFPPRSDWCWTDTTANTSYVRPNFSWIKQGQFQVTWYWRVVPIDRNGNEGMPSLVNSFQYEWTFAKPLENQPVRLVEPYFYYPPGSDMLSREDRTAPLPIFKWHRTEGWGYPAEGDSTQAAAYRIQLSQVPTFDPPDWTYDTENLAAAPTSAANFVPTPGTNYYWRVRPLTALGGTEIGYWSEKWVTRIDLNRGLAPRSNPLPQLLRPVPGGEIGSTTPLFEWWPVQNATTYKVEISSDALFTNTVNTVISGTVTYPVFAPQSRIGPGTYYWRVQAYQNVAPMGAWSAPSRFQVAAPSHWLYQRTLGNPTNRSQVAADIEPTGDMQDPDYNVTNLNVVQDASSWYFGFAVNSGGSDMKYVLYLDLDREDGSGAATDAEGHKVATIAAHRPEYAIYIQRHSGAFTADNIGVYRWLGTGWGPRQALSDIGGNLYAEASYVEIQVPNTAIGMEDRTGSLALSLFTLPLASGTHPQDTVPADPNVAYTTPDLSTSTTTVLSRFTSVTDRLTLAAPANNLTGDPATYPSLLPFAWQLAPGSPWHGYNIQASVDAKFTSLVWDYIVTWDVNQYAPDSHTFWKDFWGDNTYYWRVRPVYVQSPLYTGPWSQPGRIERQGFMPQDLQTSVTFATPTFSWDIVEGAEGYELQVDDDPNFGSLVLGISTAQNSYTPRDTLSNGAYYWRVRARRWDGIANSWSPSKVFTLSLPIPTQLQHYPAGAPPTAPTLCWQPVVAASSGVPVLAAYRYRVQVSRDPTFSSIFDNVDTEQTCWTSTRAYEDGTFYWRVAMLDGQYRQGAYSPTAEFTKQYPRTTLLEPQPGAALQDTPTFVWTPVPGAASYHVQVANNQSFSPLLQEVTTQNTRFTPVDRYQDGKTYYWRVQMVDREGKSGPYNDAAVLVSRFRVFLPVQYRDRPTAN
jgi:hypothetical protein